MGFLKTYKINLDISFFKLSLCRQIKKIYEKQVKNIKFT